MSSVFSVVQTAPPIPVFAVNQLFLDDKHPNKVNLSIGAYRTEEAKPWVLPVVQAVEQQIAEDRSLNKEYLPVSGLVEFCKQTLRLLLGEGSEIIAKNRADSVQCLGGTGAVRLGLDFLTHVLKRDVIYISNPTWENHAGIAKLSGFPSVREYRYWDYKNRIVDIAGFLEDLNNAPEGAVILLHGVAHNPTGMDPSMEQWKQIADVMEERKLFPMIDFAYQGFASGDTDADAAATRYLVGRGFETLVAQSFSKNFGLYNERVGALAVVTNGQDAGALARTLGQLRLLVRQTYSNPPQHGARIVANVLGNPALNAEWRSNVRTMANRIQLMRRLLFERLRTLGTPGTWDHIVQQTGMFSYTGLSAGQVDFIRKNYHVYAMPSGRINVCGLTQANVEYVASAIHDAVLNADK